VFNQANTTQIFDHIKEFCAKISVEKKAGYIQEFLKAPRPRITKELDISGNEDN
jgi:hypothetical protein